MRRILGLFCGLLMVAMPVMAHHSIAGQYDMNRPTTLKGTVTKVEWLNPHVYFYIDVKDNTGKVANWSIEGGSPNGLLRSGWTKNSLKLGDEVTVEGFLAKDNSNMANLSVVTVGGKRMLTQVDPATAGQK